MFIPLECLHNFSDTVTYVFMKDGINTVKQEVMIGETNVNDVIILGGLVESDKVFLSMPGGAKDDDIRLLKEMNGKRKKENREVKEEKPAEGQVIPTAATSSK
jgi:hypothetical protein